MPRVLLKKDQVVRLGSVPHKLLSDVEAECGDGVSSELSDNASRAAKVRWEGKTEVERKAHAAAMAKARWGKKPEPALIKAFNALLPKVEVPIEGPELKPKPSKKSTDDGIDWSQGNYAIASANGLTVPQVQAMRDKMLLKGELK
jgi:hypothetical protein